MKEEEEVPMLDLTKYYRYVTGKLILCYIAYTWDYHSLHKAVFRRSIAAQIRSAIYFYRQYGFINEMLNFRNLKLTYVNILESVFNRRIFIIYMDLKQLIAQN